MRYIANRSKTILGRTSIIVTSAQVTLEAPAEVVLGATVSVSWSGPNNKDDYVTLVAQETPDGKYVNYTNTSKGSPLVVTAPTVAGAAEIRYMSGAGNKVLARRPIKIIFPRIKLSGPAQCVAGSTISVAWVGPNNTGDYLTLVPKEARDGLYGNYTNTNTGTPLKLLAPIMEGEAELRYMAGQGDKVLAREPIKVVAAKITLTAIDTVATGVELSVKWIGPNNPGDYITLVPISLPDGQYGNYAYTTQGSPLTIKALKDTGEAELRYMSGQGSKVLARRLVKIIGSP